MKLVEIRELDGPNIFLLEPAIKVEFQFENDDVEITALERIGRVIGDGQAEFGAAWLELVDNLHQRAGLESPNAVLTQLEEEGHVVLAFGWSHRRAARLIAGAIADMTVGDPVSLEAVAAEAATAVRNTGTDDLPELIRDSERHIPAIGITGTNGKTTTTRLIAHIVQMAGKRPGWCSTAGVFINGDPVLDGDYTGPSGARRVLLDDAVDVAVLETARGGILLRGLGYESNDISVFTNVSADHLGLLGVQSVEGLAQVKSTVIAVTRPEGYAVLNAEDPLVWSQRFATRARVVAMSSNNVTSIVEPHLAEGGAAIVVEQGEIVWREANHSLAIAPVKEIPITYGGRATHMLENAMCAAAVGIALGYDAETVGDALKRFTSSSSSNPGRLNAYRINDAVVMLDYAHNEAGLTHLLKLAKSLIEGDGVVRAVIGAAGDRTDASIREIARLAGEHADAVYVRETSKYLRGRANNDALNQLYIDGLNAANARPVAIYPSELEAVKAAVGDALPGDVVISMSYEQGEASRVWLLESGASPLE